MSPWCCWNFEIVSDFRMGEIEAGMSVLQSPAAQLSVHRRRGRGGDWANIAAASSPRHLGKDPVVDGLPLIEVDDGVEPPPLVDELKATGQEVNTLRLGEHTVAKTVCRHAVKANDALSAPELENLVKDLRQCAMPYTCPHGRPTLIEVSYRELEKKFGRLAG